MKNEICQAMCLPNRLMGLVEVAGVEPPFSGWKPDGLAVSRRNHNLYKSLATLPNCNLPKVLPTYR